MVREEERDLSIREAFDVACQMVQAGRHEEAIGLFKGVLMHEPEHFEAMTRLGAAEFDLKRYHEALYHFWRARKLNRRSPMALTNYGLCLGQLGHWDEALAELCKARTLAENAKNASPELLTLVYNNIGNTLEKLKRYPEALKNLDRALKHDPNHQFSHYNRGIVLLRLRQDQDALEAFDRALAIDPLDADARYNRGMALLRMGRLGEGFADYEARLVTSENEVVNLGLPADKKWDGSDLTGQTLLVHGEQGLGDDIQFFRYLKPLIDRHPGAAEIKLICHSATAPLVADTSLPITMLRTGEPLPPDAYDKWVPLMSLPDRLGTKSEADIPPQFWFPVTSARVLGQAPLGIRKPGVLNVGICWAGNWLHKNDEHRSIPFSTFSRLIEEQGINFVSVQQVRPNEMELVDQFQEHYPNRLRCFLFKDFRDTAAALLQCDLVVSADTATAHLAATLGIPTWTLIPKMNTDWRWMRERSDCPWYPSMRLYRQAKIGDWAPTIDRVARDLRDAAQRAAASAA